MYSNETRARLLRDWRLIAEVLGKMPIPIEARTDYPNPAAITDGVPRIRKAIFDEPIPTNVREFADHMVLTWVSAQLTAMFGRNGDAEESEMCDAAVIVVLQQARMFAAMLTVKLEKLASGEHSK